jgi:hypothetical protein
MDWTNFNELPVPPFKLSPSLAKLRSEINATVAEILAERDRFDQVAATVSEGGISDKIIGEAQKLPARRVKLLRDELAVRTKADHEYFSALRDEALAAAERADGAHAEFCLDLNKKLVGLGFLPAGEVDPITGRVITLPGTALAHPRAIALRSERESLNAFGHANDTLRANQEAINRVAAQLEAAVRKLAAA